MHIVLALDGSEPSGIARDLVAGVAWPDGTSVRIVSALEPGAEIVSLPWPGTEPIGLDRLEAAARGDIEPMLRDAAGRMAAPGRVVDWELVRGRPAEVIIDEARRTGADVVVLGSRGHGRLQGLLLGSISTEVADRAPCPVLIARKPSLTRVVFAQDGSKHAVAAADRVTRWPVFKGIPVQVVTVVSISGPLASGIAPTMMAEALETYAETIDVMETESLRLAEETAARFREAGVPATAKVRRGETAAEVIEEANEFGADLVIVGSRGVGGLAQLLVGSVARRVLLHAPCSVLVVR